MPSMLGRTQMHDFALCVFVTLTEWDKCSMEMLPWM